jgi:putative tryptophan/tyrosine transport system substrate-binding protein
MTARVERGSYGSQACRPTSRSSSAPGLQTVSGRPNDSPPHVPDRHGATAPRRAAAAQQAGKVYRIGYVGVAPIPLDDAFRAGLRDLGYLERQNLIIEYRWGREGTGTRYANLVKELLALNVDLIVSVASPPTQAAKEATKAIPIVFVAVGDPVAYGFVSNLRQPEGNLTGLSAALTETVSKAVQLLKEIVPVLARVAILGDSNNPGTLPTMRALVAAAPTLRVQVRLYDIRMQSEFQQVFSVLAKERPEAMFVIPDHAFYAERKRIIDFVAKHRIPTCYGFRDFALAGGLMAFEPDRQGMFRRAATYVDKILKGAKPGDLPVEQPTKFDLVINMKTAKALGLTIPPSLLQRADEVIE